MSPDPFDARSLAPQETRLASPSPWVFGSVGLGTSLSSIGDALLYTVLPTHASAAGMATGEVGIILSANRLVRLLVNRPVGSAFDRLPRRPLFVLSLWLGAVSTTVYAATRGFWAMLAGRLLWGIAFSGIRAGGTSIVLGATTIQDRGRWVGLYQVPLFLGALLGPLVGGVLTDRVGYGPTMWLAAAATALAVAVAWILLMKAGDRQPHRSPDPHIAPTRFRSDGVLATVSLVHGLGRFTVDGVLVASMGLLVRDVLAVDGLLIGVAGLTGLLIAARTFLIASSAPLAGSVSDFLGSRWVVVGAGLILGAFGMAMIAWGVPWAVLLGIGLAALAGGTSQAAAPALIGDLVDSANRGEAIGRLHTAGDLGSAVGPAVTYFLLPWIGLPGVYAGCGLLFLIVLLTVGISRRRIRRGRSHQRA